MPVAVSSVVGFQFSPVRVKALSGAVKFCTHKAIKSANSILFTQFVSAVYRVCSEMRGDSVFFQATV